MQTLAEIETEIASDFNDTSLSAEIQIKIGYHHRDIKVWTGWDVSRIIDTIDTVATQSAYDLPIKCLKVISLRVTVGDNDYPIWPIFNDEDWNRLQSANTSNSDYSKYFRIRYADQAFDVWPNPASVKTMTLEYNEKGKDFASADFTDYDTGDITATNGSAAIVGNGTVFTAAMVGRHIKIDADGYWYKISAFADGTHITISRNFEGTTATGADFQIGTLMQIPQEAAPLLKNSVLEDLWRRREDFTKANKYEDLKEKGLKKLYRQRNIQVDTPDVRELDVGRQFPNPNDYPTNLSA